MEFQPDALLQFDIFFYNEVDALRCGAVDGMVPALPAVLPAPYHCSKVSWARGLIAAHIYRFHLKVAFSAQLPWGDSG